MSTEAEKRAVAAYQKRQDNIMLRPSKKDGAIIRSAAATCGQSVQQFILQAVDERLQKEELGEISYTGKEPSE